MRYTPHKMINLLRADYNKWRAPPVSRLIRIAAFHGRGDHLQCAPLSQQTTRLSTRAMQRLRNGWNPYIDQHDGPRSHALLIFVALLAFYLLAYDARIESGDGLQYFDVASSWVQHGDWLLDESRWLNTDYTLEMVQREYAVPLRVYIEWNESALIFVAAALYQLADWLPGVGYVHMVWLLNALASALTGVVFFLLVRRLTERTSLARAVTLLLCTTTIIVPYSETLFREPLAMLLLISSVPLLLSARDATDLRARIPWLLAASGCCALALFAKNSTLLAWPGLLMLILPRRWFAHRARLQVALLLSGISVIALLTILPFAPALIASFWPLSTEYMQPALKTYLFSIGGSLWGTSPLLLLAVLGAIWAFRDLARRPFLWSVVLVIAGYALGHALLVGSHWFGGLSWPSRFLVPTVPFAMLLTIPVFERLHRQSFWWLPIILLSVYGLWIQFVAVSLPWETYTNFIPAGKPLEWAPGLRDPRQLRWVLMPSLWDSLSFDFAWVRAGLAGWALFFAVIALLSMGLTCWPRTPRFAGFIAFIVVISGLFFYLRVLYRVDPAMNAQNAALHDVLDTLRTIDPSGDVLYTTSPVYHRFLANYNDLDNVRVIVLREQPGEQPGPAQAAQVISETPLDLLGSDTQVMLRQSAQQNDRLWILANNGPFTPFAVRPVERWLSTRYFWHRDVPLPTDDPSVRLIEYHTPSADATSVLARPQQRLEVQFGEVLALRGLTLPAGTTLQPGAWLPAAFTWEALQPLDRTYNIAWFLASADENAVLVHGNAGQDRPPQAGFADMAAWQPGRPVDDHRALRLPDNLAPQEARLWVVVYSGAPDGRIERLSVRGESVPNDDTIALLPIPLTIEVTPER